MEMYHLTETKVIQEDTMDTKVSHELQILKYNSEGGHKHTMWSVP